MKKIWGEKGRNCKGNQYVWGSSVVTMLCNVQIIDAHVCVWDVRRPGAVSGCSHACSVHVQEHEVRVFDQLLHARSKPCTCCAIDNSMVRADAKADLFRFFNSHAVWMSVVVDQLSDSMGLTNCNNGGLGSQDGRYEVSTTDIADTGDTKCCIIKVCLGQATIWSLWRQVF